MEIINDDALFADTLREVTERLGRKPSELEINIVIRHMDKLVDNMFESQSQDIDYIVSSIQSQSF